MDFDIELPILTVEDDATWEAILRNLYWVDYRIEDVRRLSSEHSLVRIAFAEANVPTNLIKSIESAAMEMFRLHKRISNRVLFSRGRNEQRNGISPLAELIERGSLRHIDGAIEASGLFLLLMRSLDREFLRFARNLHAEEYEFPSTLPLTLAKRCGILDNYSHHTYFIGNLQYSIETVKQLRSAITEYPDRVVWGEMLGSPAKILAPAVCYHYWGHAKEDWDDENDLEIGTALGKCYRFELPAPSTLDRLREFRMREVFAVGTTERTKEIRQRFLDYLADLLTRLDLDGNIETAFDSFYLDQYASKRFYQLGFELKFELCGWLPYQKRKIAVASVNDHRDFFTKAFDVVSRKGEQLESCCLAFGLERLALVILEQHGIDPRTWPAELRRFADEQ